MDLFTDLRLEAIAQFAEYLRALPVNNGEGKDGKMRQGCTILVRHKKSGTTFSFRLNEHDTPERRVLTWRFANEKLERISENGDARSAFTASSDEGKYAGAIANDAWIVSVSGWPADQDEVLAVYVLGVMSVHNVLPQTMTWNNYCERSGSFVDSFYDRHFKGSEFPNDSFYLLRDFIVENGEVHISDFD
jgi:hypothetical protein